MKNVIFIFTGLFLSLSVLAQSPTDWTNTNPGNVSVFEETTNVNEGSSALGVTCTTQDQTNTEFMSASFTVTPGASYSASVDVYDNDSVGKVRLAINWDGTNAWGGYSSDGESWETIEETGTVPDGVTTAYVFFRFYDETSVTWDGDFSLILDNVTFTEDGGSNLVANGGFENWETLTPTAYTIPEIQDTVGNGGGNGSAIEGEYVETEGIVTAVYADEGKYVIQDGTGEWSGIWVAGSGAAQGDSVTVTGSVSEDGNLTQILADDVVVNNSGNTLPSAEVLPTGDCGQEAWEGVLLETTGTCTNDTVEDNYGEFPLDDGSGEILVDDYGLADMYYPTQDLDYTVTSPLTFNYGAFKIAVREEADIIEDVGTEPYLAITSPSDGATVNTTDVNIEFNVQNFTLGDGTGDGYILYSVDGGTAQNHYSDDPIQLTGLSEDEHTANLELVDDTGSPLDPAVTASVSFTVNLSGTTSIYDIQYTEDASGDSPMVDQEVTISGIVTAVDGDNFWIQDAPGAWNGIYVYYAQSGGPAIGDSVTATGTVEEYYDVTQISSVTDMTVISNGHTPSVAEITTDQANGEGFESVLVQVEGTNNGPVDDYGQWPVNDGSGNILIDDELFSYTPTEGNDYRVTGVTTYSFSEWKIWPRDSADVEDLGVSTDPAVIINSPGNGDVIYTDAVDVNFVVNNFDLGTDGKLAYSIDGGTVSYQTTSDPVSFTDLSEAEHTVDLELVDMSENPLSPAVTASVTFT
ncbi:MAG: hypothetical protein R6V32_11180, partial [Bacteroidales bacterium]